ncbi:MAG: VanZ family protein [Ruminococcus sp.]
MKAETKKCIRILSWILFILYLILLMYFLFFSEWYGRKNWIEEDYRYNLVLFKEIGRFWTYREQLGMEAVLLNLVGNIIGFLPFGFILPVISKRTRRFWITGLLGFLMSLFVECLQLAGKVGCFDVDDLLLNTAGALSGYLFFLICNGIRRWYYEKKI